MRSEKLYLEDMLEAAQAIQLFCAGAQYPDFQGNDLLRSAVLLKLIVIGEAAAHLPAEFQARHPEVGWPDIISFRNFAVHVYFAMDWQIVWVTATQDVKTLARQVDLILKEEFQGE